MNQPEINQQKPTHLIQSQPLTKETQSGTTSALKPTTRFGSKTASDGGIDADNQSTVTQKGTEERAEHSDNMILNEKQKKRLYLNELRDDLAAMPTCAEKTSMELLKHFEQKVIGDHISTQEEETVNTLLNQLEDQLKQQELLSEDIRIILPSLKRSVHSGDCLFVTDVLSDLLKRVRPLNVPEIKRLVEKAVVTGKLIYQKDIVLLVGATGAGKSTTIQFLAGSKMEETKVEVEPGRFLDHITAVGPISNLGLNGVTSSPRNKSETRYIAAVTIPLKEIYGPSKTGDILLCDAPGFADTAGPEVNIANGVGVIEALKGCTSVKLLALSSYLSLGDRGQGIRELAQILVSMVKGIEDRLDAIFYAFTKYPEDKDVCAILTDIKISKVNTDPHLGSDNAFVAVLDDMIEKTQTRTEKVDPVCGNRRNLIDKLNRMTGISFPAEVFRFSMSEATQKIIENEAQRYELSIKRAAKLRKIDLVDYYLCNLKTLKDLIKNGVVADAYTKSMHFMCENINEYCVEAKSKFNRALESQDGLREEDVRDYKTSVEYIQDVQKALGGHFQSGIMSSATLIQNIHLELRKTRLALAEDDLHSFLTKTYLNNLRMLKSAFRELESEYSSSCRDFADRFDILVESASKPILANEFSHVAEIILAIYKASRNLQSHLGEKMEEKYRATIELLLKHLSSFSEKADPILEKVRLNDGDVKILSEYMEVLRSAKESSTLYDRLLAYVEILEKRPATCPNNFKSLNEFYNNFIDKIVKYFDEINVTIKVLFDKNGDYALEQIEKLVSDMDNIRTIPEIEAKTSGTYYRTVENVRGYMQQLQKDAEQLLVDIDKKSGSINYSHLAQSLSRLKNAQWINRVSPGAYETLMRRIREELIENAEKLEEQLKRLDFHLRYPDNVAVAQDIVENIRSMRNLERSVPELEKYRIGALDRFRETTQGVFDIIQKTFNLQDRDVYTLKQQLKELEKIKNEYESFHPAEKYLQEQHYLNIDQLNGEIEDLDEKLKDENNKEETMQREKEEKLNELQGIIQQYMVIRETNSDKNLLGKVLAKGTAILTKGKSEEDSFLEKQGFYKIDDVYEAKLDTNKAYNKKLQLIKESCKALSDALNGIEAISKKHKSLLLVRSDSVSSAGMQYLRDKKQNGIESLNAEIQEKKIIISEREKNKQTYDFSGRFDGYAANNALSYVIQCEKLGDFQVKKTATETHAILQKYISEYGHFLNQEIGRLYQNASTSDVAGGPFQYAHELYTRLEELSSLTKFPGVFECIAGAEKVAHWQREVVDCYTTLDRKMEEYRTRGEDQQLRKQLLVVYAFSCLDRLLGNTRFIDLYRKHQLDMNTDVKEGYRNILSHISKLDYANAGIALTDIDDNPLNQRAKRQIEHELNSSLVRVMKDTKSMAHWLYGKIERQENRGQIEEIKNNIEKIRTALVQCNLVDLLEEKTKSDLRNFDSDIDKILSDILLKGLASIEKYMNNDNFDEAEQGIENISRVQRDLTGICTSEEVIEKTEKLKEKLGVIVGNLLNIHDFTNIDKYFEKPPKDLLTKLKVVSVRGPEYQQAYTTLMAKLKQNFSHAIDLVRTIPTKERSAKLRSLGYALCFVPDELQGPCKTHIDEISTTVRNEDKDNESELDNSLRAGDENEHAFTKMSKLAKRFQEKEMDEFSAKMHDEILKRLQIYRTNLQSSLDEHDMQSALKIVDKIIKYKASVSSYIPGIQGIYDTTRKSTIKSFETSSKILAEISKIEKPEIAEKALRNAIACVDFSVKQDTADEEFLPKTAVQNCEKDLKIMRDYLQDNSEKYRQALETMTIDDLHTALAISQRWQKLLHQVKDCATRDGTTKSLIPDVQNVVIHTDMICGITKEISSLKAQLNVELISDETTKFETKREAFFSQLKKSISKLKEIDAKLQDVLPTPVNAKGVRRES